MTDHRKQSRNKHQSGAAGPGTICRKRTIGLRDGDPFSMGPLIELSRFFRVELRSSWDVL